MSNENEVLEPKLVSKPKPLEIKPKPKPKKLKSKLVIPELKPKAPEPKPEPKMPTWHGHPVYKCDMCAYDTLDKARLDEHARVHAGPPPASSRIVRVDRFGNEIKE